MPGLVPGAGPRVAHAKDGRPNILFAIADDWSWPHANMLLGEVKVVRTPTFDRLAREGVLFSNAFVSSPSCTPSRAAILTGQWHWRLEESANLWSTLKKKFVVYPDLLEAAGYHVGYTRKGWGPGNFKDGDRKRNPAGPSFRSFGEFMKARPEGKPFCFWFGSSDPHRGYRAGSGVKSGMRPGEVQVPACLPDAREVRSDLCDYYWEVQRFDREVGAMLGELERSGELENTIVVMTGDNGLPFPRCKSNLYDTGTKVPLAVRWGARAEGGRVVTDFASLTDLAPTFLEAAGLKAPPAMTGGSLVGQLVSTRSGRVDPTRDHVLTGMERHTPAQEFPDKGGYPCRAIRTGAFLYIRNFRPDRWPAGTPDAAKSVRGVGYSDIDGGPTKSYMLAHRDDPAVRPLVELAAGRRPAEELYDLKEDPDQLRNVADRREYPAARKDLASRLMAELRATGDPRAVGGGEVFDTYRYYGGVRRRKPK
ncbi:MAG: sulfatase family protein [Planctomycetota bacterium]